MKEIKFEVFRALAIIMVVLIHTVPAENYLFLRQLFNFAVPLFIFLAGYFYNLSKYNSMKRKYIFEKIFRVLVPYLFWSILILSVYFIANRITITDFLLDIATGGALGPYYFIIVLLQLIVFSPIMIYLNKSNLGKLILFMVTPLSLLILYILRLNENVNFNGLYYALPFTTWFIFYYLGYLLKNSNLIERLLTSKKSVIIFFSLYIIFLGASMLEAFLIIDLLQDVSFAASQLKFSSFMMSIFLIITLLLIRIPVNKATGFLAKIGNMSFGIFLIHMIVVYVARVILDYYYFSIDFPIFWFSLSFFGSIIAISIKNMIFKSNFFVIILGF